MSLAPRAVVGFSCLVAAALAAVMATPAPYPEGTSVDGSTGAPRPGADQALAAVRATGSLAVLADRLSTFVAAGTDASVVRGLATMAQAEAALPAFDEDPTKPAPVEGFFRDVPANGLDARAAALQQRLQAGQRPAVDELLALATAFRAAGRPRAELRWLQRAVRLHPEGSPAADQLLVVLLAHARLEDALRLVQAHAVRRADDLVWQRHLAQLGAWLGRPEVEIEALERLTARASEPSDRSRLIELWAHLGQPERALPHAIALVDSAAEVAAAEAGASGVLRSGFADEGLAMLQRAAERATTAAPWWQRFALLARQDLRIEAAVAAMAKAAELDPVAADPQLEEIYRRTDQPERLADLLQRRLARLPGDAAAWRELITLRHALGQREQALRLAAQRDVALADPGAFVAELPAGDRSPANALREQALSLSLGPAAESGVVGETLERLRPFLAQPGFRTLAESLLVRYPADPRAKAMRTELVDMGRGPAEAERAAAALSDTYPDDVTLAQLWLQRAMWAENASAQVAARERLLTLAPEDRTNRHELADLLEYTGRPREAIVQWRALIEQQGPNGTAAPRLIAALYAVGDSDEAVEWLRRLAADPAASLAQRLHAADELFDRRRHDEAKVLYEAVLAAHADEPRATWRLGLLAAWRGDPATAVQLFERRLAASGERAGLVRFQLGEALWQLGDAERARAEQANALRELATAPSPDMETRLAIAVMLDRAGRGPEAVAAWTDLVARQPRDSDLVLDCADVLLRHGEPALASAAVAQAEALRPDSLRAARLRAEIGRRSGDAAAARQALERALLLAGDDRWVLGDLATLRRAAGDLREAQQLLRRRRAIDPHDAETARGLWQVDELLADLGEGHVRQRRIGRERHREAGLGGLVRLDDRHWLQGEVAAFGLRGTSSLFADGEAAVDFVRLTAGLGVRSGANDHFLVGAEASPGADGDAPLGLHATAHFEWPDLAVLQLQARWHELWMEPAAAAVLGGRQSGVDALGHADLGARTWATVGLGVGHFALDDELAAGRADTQVHADVTAGWNWLDGEPAVATWFAPQLAPAGPHSPFLQAGRGAAGAWAGQVSLTWRAVRGLQASELADVLPFAERDDQLTAAVRVDHRLADTCGAAIAGHAGVDLRTGEPIYGIAAALNWRPTFATEVTLEGSRGASFSRGDDADVEELRLQVVLRW